MERSNTIVERRKVITVAIDEEIYKFCTSGYITLCSVLIQLFKSIKSNFTD